MLADTKYEFGFNGNTLTLIDEIHTPDSSRYFYLEGFEALRESGKAPVQLSKEYLREWLRTNGFTGKAGEDMPRLTDEVRLTVYQKYAALFQLITGQPFTPVITPHFDHTLLTILKKYQS